MLFHGTVKKDVAGILETGYGNSVKGDFGRGVYQPKVLTWRLYIPVEETLKKLTSCLSTKFSSLKSLKHFFTKTRVC